MSTTAKIDFEPGLFDEGRPEAAPDLPTLRPKPFPAITTEGQQRPVRAILTPAPGVGAPTLQKATVGDSESFCVGHEAMCSTSTTDKPAETLAKLAAALPHGQAKRYRAKVSVAPVGQ